MSSAAPAAPLLPAASDGFAPRILIVRLSSIGDLVFTTSLLRALRAAYPKAQIGWLARRELVGWLQADPDIDQVHAWDPPKSRNPWIWWMRLRALRRELRGADYDIAIEAQGLLKSRVLCRLSAARRRFGFDSREPGGFLLHTRIPKAGQVRLISSEYRDLAERLTGRFAPPPSLRLPPPQREVPQGVAVLCPFTTRPQKHWFDDYWPQLAALLKNNLGLDSVILGGPGDREHAQRLLAQCPPGTRSLAGETSLIEAAQAIERARVLIGVDTGLTHMGVALGIPTVPLFGSTVPYREGGSGPMRVLYDERHCSPCKRRPSCGGAYTCMRDLTPMRAFEAARELIAGRVA